MRTNRRSPCRIRHAASALLALALSASPAGAQSLSDPNLSVTPVVSGLAQPTAMAFVGPADFLVLLKGGDVRRVLSGVLQATPAGTVLTNPAGETGLLGIAVNSEVPRKVFLYYSAASTQGGSLIEHRVVRYTWNSSSGLLESPQTILTLPIGPGPSHNGGALVMGPANQAPGVGDGALLYLVIGDLGRNGKLQNVPSGPSPDNSSVILRVRQDGTAAPGNPFNPICSGDTTQTCSNDGACGADAPCLLSVAKYFAYGVRNSFGLALDPVTGLLWDTENGPNNFDEVNRVAPGLNSGWNAIMGPDSSDPQGTGDLWNMPGGSTYSDPEFSWSLPPAPTALVLPVGSNLGSDYDDKLLVGDFNFAQLYAFPLDATRNGFNFAAFPDLADLVADNNAETNQLRIGTGFGNPSSGIVDLEIGPDGALYVVAIGGSVYRVSGPGAGTVVTPRPPQPHVHDLGRRLGEAASDALDSQP